MQSRIPVYLNQLPEGAVLPPVETKSQLLPFGELNWEDFERLCYQLAYCESDIEYCLPYGTRGQEQGGIDIFARYGTNQQYVVYQCKREKEFGPAKIRKAVELFLSGEWRSKSSRFVLCVTEPMFEAKRATAIEVAAAKAKAAGVSLICWGPTELSRRLKVLPRVVADFFGNAWASQFCGEHIFEPIRLLRPLSLGDVKRARQGCRKLYRALFRSIDPGLPDRPITQGPSDLLGRYVPGRVRKHVSFQSLSRRVENATGTDVQPRGGPDASTVGSRMPQMGPSALPLQDFLAGAERCLVVGEAGAGKSALLRYLALSLASGDASMPKIANKWAGLIPIYIPFAAWTERVEHDHDCSIQDVVRSWFHRWDSTEGLIALLQRALADERVILLVDGLDEAHSDASGQRALTQLQVFLERGRRPAVVTTRAQALSRLELSGAGWQLARLCELSEPEQLKFIESWCQVQRTSSEQQNQPADLRPDRLLRELRRTPQVRGLASNPLLLSILVSLKLAGKTLPTDRVEAYGAFVSFLLEMHPRRRTKATVVSSRSDSAPSLRTSEIYHLLEELAWETHSTNFVLYEDSRRVAEIIRTELEVHFRFPPLDARRLGTEFVELGVNYYGILLPAGSEEAHFAHASFHSHFAGKWLARQGQTARIIHAKRLATSRGGAEILLSTLMAVGLTSAVDKLIEAIESLSGLNATQNFSRRELLAEVAFGPYPCSEAASLRIAADCIGIIEGDGWAPHRGRLLESALRGLVNPVVSSLVAHRIQRWVPDRGDWTRRRLIDAIGTWEDGRPEVVDSLVRAARNGSREARAGACTSLVGLGRVDLVIQELESPNSLTQEAAFYAIAVRGNGPSGSALRYAESIESPSMELLALYCQVQKSANEGQVDAFLKVAGFPPTAMPDWSNAVLHKIGSCLWSHKSVHDAVIQALSQDRPARGGLSQELALSLLLANGPVPGAGRAFARWIHRGVHYPHQSYAAWKRFGEMFREDPDVREAAFRKTTELLLPSRCQGWLLIGGEIARRSLLGLLQSGQWGAPGFPASILLDLWGVDDTEVVSAIAHEVHRDRANAAKLGDLIPAVLSRDESRRILLDCLADTEIGSLWNSKLVYGLEQIGALEDDSVFEMLHEIAEHDSGEVRGAVLRCLLRVRPLDSRVIELAEQEMSRRDARLGDIAHGYSLERSPTIGTRLLDAVAPLPTAMRLQIVRGLDELLGSAGQAVEILRRLELDVDEAVATAATLALCRDIRARGGHALVDEQERLQKIATSYGLDLQARRRMAVAGLSELGALGCMRDAQEPGDWYQAPAHWKLEFPFPHESGQQFVQQLMSKWDDVIDALGQERWRDHLLHSERTWETATPAILLQGKRHPFVETSLRDTEPEETPAGLLEYLGQRQPRSRQLLERCFAVLMAPGSVGLSTLQTEAAARLIGEHFRGDETVLERLEKAIEVRRAPSGRLLAALVTGWWDSPLAAAEFAKLVGRPIQFHDYSVWMIRCAMLRPSQLLERLAHLLVGYPDPWATQDVVRPMLRRLDRDPQLVELFQNRLEETRTMSEVATLSRLLSASGRPSSRLVDWCTAFLARPMARRVGYDLVARRRRCVRDALLDAVAGPSGQS